MSTITEKELRKIEKETLKQAKVIIKKTFMSDEHFLRQYKNLKVKDLSKLRPLEEEMELYTRFFDISIRKFNEETSPETKVYNDNQFYNINHKTINYPLLIKLLEEAGVVLKPFKLEDVDNGKEIFPNSINYYIDRYASKESKYKENEENNKQI